MNNNFLKHDEKLENLTNQIVNLTDNSNEFQTYFNYIDQKEIEAYLNFLKNYHEIEISNIFSNSNLEDNFLKKYTIIYLLIRNFVNSQKLDVVQSKINTLNYLKDLNDDTKNNIIKIYLLSGLYFIYQNLDHPIINLKKSLIKYFHDLGGFEIGLWGINIKLEVFKEMILIENLKKILNKHKKVSWDDLYMLNYYHNLK